MAVRTSAPETQASMSAKPAARKSAMTANQSFPFGGACSPRPTRYSGTTAAPTIAETNPNQNTRREPYADVVYRTAKIARSDGDGCRPNPICARAAAHATQRARPG